MCGVTVLTPELKLYVGRCVQRDAYRGDTIRTAHNSYNHLLLFVQHLRAQSGI